MLKVKTHEKQFLNVTGETYGVKKKIEYYQQRNLYYMYKYLNKKKKTRYMYYLIFILMNACP